MDTVVEVLSDSGMLLLADPAQRAAMSDEILYWLSAFTDPEGETEIVCDFEQPWPVAWRRAAAEINEFGESGRFIVIKSVPGRYFLRIVLGTAAVATSQRIYESALAHVTVRTGQLEISDGTNMNRPSVIAVPIGEYQASIDTLIPEDDVQIVGVFGGDGHPAILVTLSPRENLPSVSIPLIQCSRAALPAEASPGRLCRAEVKKVEDSIAILRLQVAEHLWSGYGRLHVTPGQAMTPGKKLLVRLREHTGSWWWCDLP